MTYLNIYLSQSYSYLQTTPSLPKLLTLFRTINPSKKTSAHLLPGAHIGTSSLIMIKHFYSDYSHRTVDPRLSGPRLSGTSIIRN